MLFNRLNCFALLHVCVWREATRRSRRFKKKKWRLEMQISANEIEIGRRGPTIKGATDVISMPNTGIWNTILSTNKDFCRIEVVMVVGFDGDGGYSLRWGGVSWLRGFHCCAVTAKETRGRRRGGGVGEERETDRQRRSSDLINWY